MTDWPVIEETETEITYQTDFGKMKCWKPAFFGGKSDYTDDLQVYQKTAEKLEDNAKFVKKFQYKCLVCDKMYQQKRERDHCKHEV